MARITIEVSDEVATRLLHFLQTEKGAATNGTPTPKEARRDTSPDAQHDPMLAA